MLHAPTDKRERIVAFADRGGGKSSVYISIADWMDRTGSDRRIWLYDSDKGWDANRPEDGSLDKYVEVLRVDREEFGGDKGWHGRTKAIRGHVNRDDWAVVDLQTHAWEGAQRWYWGQKSGNDSLAELWLRNKPQDVSGDHGTNWGVINKFYGEFTAGVVNLGCHVLFLASATEMRSNAGLDERNFYGGTGMRMEGQKDLRGEGNTVVYLFEGNGKYRMTSVKERGPIGRVKRKMVVNEDITDVGFVPGYLMKVAGWKP